MSMLREATRRVCSTRAGRLAIIVGAIHLLGWQLRTDAEPMSASPRPPPAPLKPLEPMHAYVSRAELGARWPLTVDAGTLFCEPPGLVALRSPDGRVFALNGAAESRYPRIDTIWARDEAMSELAGEDMRVSIGPLITKGRALCRE